MQGHDLGGDAATQQGVTAQCAEGQGVQAVQGRDHIGIVYDFRACAERVDKVNFITLSIILEKCLRFFFIKCFSIKLPNSRQTV